MSERDLEQVRQECKQALAEVRRAQSEADKLLRLKPLPATEDIDWTDGDALTQALERLRTAMDRWLALDSEYEELQRQDSQSGH